MQGMLGHIGVLESSHWLPQRPVWRGWNGVYPWIPKAPLCSSHSWYPGPKSIQNAEGNGTVSAEWLFWQEKGSWRRAGPGLRPPSFKPASSNSTWWGDRGGHTHPSPSHCVSLPQLQTPGGWMPPREGSWPCTELCTPLWSGSERDVLHSH